MGNAILFYFTISKNYFINYTIPFYNTPNILKLYSFTILLKYYFLILVRLQRWRERDERPCEASCSLFASPFATTAINTPNPLPPSTQPPQQLHQSPKKSRKSWPTQLCHPRSKLRLGSWTTESLWCRVARLKRRHLGEASMMEREI